MGELVCWTYVKLSVRFGLLVTPPASVVSTSKCTTGLVCSPTDVTSDMYPNGSTAYLSASAVCLVSCVCVLHLCAVCAFPEGGPLHCSYQIYISYGSKYS